MAEFSFCDDGNDAAADMVLFYFSLFKYLILIIGSPVFAYLSEKTEAIIEEQRTFF